MTNINFKCPYCGQTTTITDPNYFEQWLVLDLHNPTVDQILDLHQEDEMEERNEEEINELKTKEVGVLTRAITCPNLECNKLWLHYSLWTIKRDYYDSPSLEEKILDWQLMPESEAKVLPDYIPQAIQDDYYEACRIRDLSPKASATLSRRCLQGMIRDFHNIKKGRLIDEIKELEDKIDPLVWSAIDSVRSVANIGAHMEKDINLIIDVEPNEAQLLIGLIEQLIDDWYINRFEKENKLKLIKKIAENKQTQKDNQE
ncbi:MAG TPA: DUF4145 domain-containing protein [Ignavibacteria bacterium]|nr:DUF4145 domain-containing protein [Ignavibacteria bacterium]